MSRVCGQVKYTATKGQMKVLVGVTGSVATVKLPNLLESLFLSMKGPLEIRVVATKAALHFIDSAAVTSSAKLFTDEDEWGTWTTVSDPILHIELRNWADVFLIAPLDANTLGKLANGLCDNLLVWPLCARERIANDSYLTK